jgi:hypothetical protein
VAARLGAIGRQAHVYAAPGRQAKIGLLRPGTTVALRSEKSVSSPGCKTSRWLEIEPVGYVCEDDNVTRDLSLPLFRALAAVAPDREAVLPYSYGLSTGSPMYGQLPTAEEARRAERRYRPPAKIRRPERPSGHEELTAVVPPPEAGPPPFYLADHRPAPHMAYEHDGLVRKDIREGNMLSFRGTTRDEAGRLFLLATNLTAVPADRVWLYRTSEFQGVELDTDHAAPLGWVRRQPRPRYHRKPGGAFAPVKDATFAARTPVFLTGAVIEQGGESYQETREPGVFARLSDLSLVAPESDLPKGVAEGERWVDVSLSQGTLTVFSGTKAVYSTLMSPGAGGTTQSSALSIEELLAGAFTPLGVFRVSFKYREAIMTPEDRPDPEKTWIDDVPYVQYFRPPYAIHTTYWHEDFGMPKSGGCINVSPRDARYLFGQTEPRVPDDWQGASNGLSDRPSTAISIRK